MTDILGDADGYRILYQTKEMRFNDLNNGAWEELTSGSSVESYGKIRYQIESTLTDTTPSTPINGFTPSLSGCDDSKEDRSAWTDEQWESYSGTNQFTCGDLPEHTTIYNKGQSIIFSVGVDYDSDEGYNNASLYNGTTLTHITADPSISFQGVTFNAGDNMNDEKNEGNWKFGVDRDGCKI